MRRVDHDLLTLPGFLICHVFRLVWNSGHLSFVAMVLSVAFRLVIYMSNFKFSNIILKNKYSSYTCSTIQTAQRLYAGFASMFIERGSWFLLCIVPICPSSEQVLWLVMLTSLGLKFSLRDSDVLVLAFYKWTKSLIYLLMHYPSSFIV